MSERPSEIERGLSERPAEIERGLSERPAEIAADGLAVERVRADLAHLADDASSAPAVPSSVTERVVSVLRAASPPAHASRRSAARFGAAVGTAAALTAAALGSVMLLRSDEPPPAASAQHLTAEPPPVTVPLSAAEIVGLLTQPPDLGALGDARRRSSCLSGLGYPASETVLGARQVVINGAPAVVLALRGDTPDTVAALAVHPNCSLADTGLLASTQIRRP